MYVLCLWVSLSVNAELPESNQLHVSRVYSHTIHGWNSNITVPWNYIT